MEKNFIKKYVSEEKRAAYEKHMKAMQEGGAAPVPADAGAPQAAPQGGGPNPEQMIQDFITAEQQQPQGQQSLEIAYAFMSMVAQDYMSQAQAAGATPAMRAGGVAPKPKMVFDKDGKRIG